MTTRTATVLWVNKPVSLPDNGQSVMEVVTDYPAACERALWLRIDGPEPPEGARITYGDVHATWSVDGVEVTARKVGYAHDPYQALG